MTQNTLTEHDLILYLQRGESFALEYIYDHYSSSLYGIILKILHGRREIAEDVLQETLMKVWQNREQYNSVKGSIFTWMLNIARNTAIDKLRSTELNAQAVNRVPLDSVSIDEEVYSKIPDYAESANLREILSKLPKEQLQIIELMYFQGYTQSEIAKEFSIPLGTIKSRARLAIESLRHIFSEEPNSTPKNDGNSMRNEILLAIIFVLNSGIIQETDLNIPIASDSIPHIPNTVSTLSLQTTI